MPILTAAITTTCVKCGKIDLPIMSDDRGKVYVLCPACGKKTANPVPDDFENQKLLTTFFVCTKREQKAPVSEHKAPRMKQTYLATQITTKKPKQKRQKPKLKEAKQSVLTF
jgi:rRNA maturation protein Nop10